VDELGVITNELPVFCDESGNTGSNFLDADQPVYVLAGWGVKFDGLLSASALVESCRSRYGIRGELRAKNLLKTRAGCKAAADLIDKLSPHPCFPIFTIVEKRYAVAAKIVDTYLHYAYNPEAPKIVGFDAVACQELADLFCGIPEDLLRRFAAAYRTLDILELKAVAFELGTIKGTKIPRDILRAIPGVVPKLSEIVGVEAGFRSSQPNNAIGSLNFPVFVNMLCLVESLAERANTRATVHHDRIVEFEQCFQWIFDAYRSSKGAGKIKLTSGVTIPLSLQHINELVMAESHSNSLIQAADILAGVLSQVSVSAIKHTETSQPLKEIASKIYSLVRFDDPLRFGALLASNSFFPDVAKSLYPNAQ
jgi:hypothetical protein